jgi:RNA recognition motif-containing protein
MTTVFIGNIAETTTRDSITTLFASAGTIVRVTVNRRRTRSRPYAFVEYDNEESVQKALEMFNGTELDGSEIAVEVAHPRKERAPREEGAAAASDRPRGPRRPRTRRAPIDAPISKTVAYVGNLPFVADEESLGDIFEGCPFVEARIVRNRDRSKGFGFVTFATEEDRDTAIERVDGSLVEGRKITVSPARERIETPPEHEAAVEGAEQDAAF